MAEGLSKNDLLALKLIVETSERQQQIFQEKQNSNSAILLRVLEQTTLEDGTSNPGTLLSIADSRRKQEEGLAILRKDHNDLLLRILEKVSPESGPIEREK